MATLVLQPAALREKATPQPMIASPKLYPSVWLLSVLPVAVLVALDAAAGVMRPSTWLVRFTPALLTLGLVAWATLSAGPRAIRLKKELRLISPMALLLAMSGFHWLGDASVLSAEHARLVVSYSAALALPMVAVVCITVWSEEQRLGTLLALAVEPRAKTIALEKFALSAFFVVISYLQLESSPFINSDLHVATRIAHLLAITAAPFLFLKSRSVGFAIAAFAAIPTLFVAAPKLVFDYDWPPAVLYAAAATGGALMLVLARQNGHLNLARPPEALPANGLYWPALVEARLPAVVRVEARLMTGAFIVIAIGPMFLLYPGVLSRGAGEALFILPTLVGFFVCALTPALSLAEARAQTEQELTLHPRAVVFRRKLLSSFAVAILGGLAAPFAYTCWSTAADLSSSFDAMWLIVAITIWACSFALSTVLKSAGSVLAATAGLVLGAFTLQFFSCMAGAVIFEGQGPFAFVNVPWPWVPAAAMGIVGPAALAFAWLHFVKQLRPARLANVLLVVCVTHAATLGAASLILRRLISTH